MLPEWCKVGQRIRHIHDNSVPPTFIGTIADILGKDVKIKWDDGVTSYASSWRFGKVYAPYESPIETLLRVLDNDPQSV